MDKQTEIVNVTPPPPELTFGESILFNELYRLSNYGDRGLFMLLSSVNKSGMIRVGSFSGQTKKTVRAENLTRLDQYRFNLEDGSSISLPEVFDNLNIYSDDALKALDIKALMATMVPHYDPELFRAHHARMVKEWYFEIKNKVELFKQKIK